MIRFPGGTTTPRKETPGSRGATVLALLLAGLGSLGMLTPAPVAAQEEILELAAECGGGDAVTLSRCREVALRTQAARGVIGLLASGGPVLPGSAGTVGLRIGGVPRISAAARLQMADASFTGRLPPTGDPLPGGTVPGDDVFVTGLDLTGAVGLFDGFAPAPTVGGLLSLDLVGTGAFLFLPEDRGFPSSEFVFGAGARVGLLRESFTLPGISASVVRRWGGEIVVSGGGGSGAGGFDFSSTSYRLTAGKDLLGVGVLLGAGLDRYSGAVSISTSEPSGPVGDPSWDATLGDLSDSRPLLFAGASLNYLVLQLSAELGWIGGFDQIPGRPSGYDPTAGSWFGGLGVRLTY